MELAEMLQTYGGWGVAVILGGVVKFLFSKNEEKNDRLITLLEDQNKILTSLKLETDKE